MSKYIFKESYLVFQNCSVVLFIIGFLYFLSKINFTTLPCLFFVISFRCFVGDIDTGVVYSHKPT